MRDQIVKGMLNAGVMVGACGTQTIRFRPPLTFTLDEVDVLLSVMGQALRDVVTPARSSL